MILGTAGHIDHGKTQLVKALTGVDTDRLPEERRRGITIELGFAPLALTGVGTVGVVDVPGHEAFVRTMLAGASGIDLALLVVAADEGVMPQTREHLAILQLLAIRGGVVALTKSDLVDADWLELVTEDVVAAVAGTPLERAPVVPVSAVTGAGLDELRAALASQAARLPTPTGVDLFRLPVDRSFTVRGTGTVVTGTVWTGRLSRDETVRVMPGGRVARVRAMQTHGQAVDAAGPGSRLALNLGGIDVADVPRGATLITDPGWEPVDVVRADVTMLAPAPAIGPRTRLRFHLGTRDVGARMVSAAIESRPSSEARQGGMAAPVPARIILDEPILVRGGDRFVLRTGSPAATVGGGIVTDAAPAHARVKPWLIAGQSLAQRLLAMAHDADARGIALAALPVRLGVPPSDVTTLVTNLGDQTLIIEDTLYDYRVIEQTEERLLHHVDVHHARSPLDEGLSLQSLRGAVQGSPALIDHLLARLVARQALGIDHGIVRRGGWAVRPTAAQQAALEGIERAVLAAGREPPTTVELAADGLVMSSELAMTLLRILERRGIVRQVEPERFYSSAALEELTRTLRTGMAGQKEYSPAELRELLGVSRKYLIPLLEYYDRHGVTERRASGRILAGPARPGSVPAAEGSDVRGSPGDRSVA